MAWLQSIDTILFRWINQSLSNPFFDGLMPFLSGNVLFVPVLVLLLGFLLIRGGVRGRLCVVFLALGLWVGDGLISQTLKRSLGRPRPFLDVPEARVLGGKTSSGSMPSAHALNCFAAAAVAAAFYPRRRRWLYGLAGAVAFSRVYNGVHYPTDVLVGALLGWATAAGLLHGVDGIWRMLGRRWFPLWQARLPSLRRPGAPSEPCGPVESDASDEAERQWLRLGYGLIGLLFLGRLGYLISGSMELSEDEAYQWLWSKHLALSYYSKPPMIAFTQWLGTWLWGDTELGVRFFSPVIGAVLSLVTFRLFVREAGAKAGVCMVLVLTTTPLLEVGATLMTIDPLSVLFWTAAMMAGWRAVESGATRYWLWAGLWTGLGFLSKYTALFQLASWVLFLVVWPPARVALRRVGPWLGLGVVALCSLPVLIWNWQHGWITVTHLAERGGLANAWRFRPALILEFTVIEFGLLNPVWFVAALLAAVATWRRRQTQPFRVFLFCMGAPLFLFYWLYNFRARVLPNWIAPAILPLFFLMGLHWFECWRAGSRRVASWFTAGLLLGLLVVIVGHETRLISKVTGRPLPAKQDPLRRVRGWKETAHVVEVLKAKLEAEGKPVFIVGAHYGITGQLSFYMPEARAAVQQGGVAVVYYQASERPQNQFFFWPGYAERKGQNALYVLESSEARGPSQEIVGAFASVEDLGLHPVVWKDRVLRHLQIYACRGLL